MGQNVPLCDSPHSLPHHVVVRLLGEALQYIMYGVPQQMVSGNIFCISLVLSIHNKDHSLVCISTTKNVYYVTLPKKPSFQTFNMVGLSG